MSKKCKILISLVAIVSCTLGVRTYAMESLEAASHTNEIKQDKKEYLNSLTRDTKAIVDMKTKLLKNVNFSEISKTTPDFEDIAICFLFQRKNFLEKFEELINIFEYAIPPAPAIDLDKNKQYKFNYKESDYIDILKHSSFDTKTDDEIRNYIDKNLYSLDRIYIDKGDENE